jgi:RNA polymerase sporulation-specific sigma factor
MEKWREDLITDNLNLVYFSYEKLPKTPFTVTYKDDLISEGNVGLCKAAIKYNPELDVAFSSFAISCIKNEMLMFIRRDKNKISNTVSLDAPISDDEDLFLSDMISDKTEIDDKILYKQILEKLRNKIKPKHYDIFVMWLNGSKYREIAEIYGHSVSCIAKIIHKIKNNLKKGEMYGRTNSRYN